MIFTSPECAKLRFEFKNDLGVDTLNPHELEVGLQPPAGALCPIGLAALRLNFFSVSTLQKLPLQH